jgi:hypothetical protein
MQTTLKSAVESYLRSKTLSHGGIVSGTGISGVARVDK